MPIYLLHIPLFGNGNMHLPVLLCIYADKIPAAMPNSAIWALPNAISESFEVSVDRPIFIIGIDAPADPDHTPEIVVVPTTP